MSDATTAPLATQPREDVVSKSLSELIRSTLAHVRESEIRSLTSQLEAVNESLAAALREQARLNDVLHTDGRKLESCAVALGAARMALPHSSPAYHRVADALRDIGRLP